MSVAEPMRLEPGLPKRQLAEGETHPYLLRLEVGEYVRIVAEQRGVDLVLRLVSPGGELIAKVDSPTGTRGFERVSEIAEAAGEYRVEVVGGEGTPKGDYEILVAERRAAMPADRKRVEGERVFLEGEDLRRGKKIEEATARYERALGLWREAGDLAGQAKALYSIGGMRERLDRWQEAVDLCTQAAELYRQAGEPTGQAEALNRSGRLLIRLSRPAEALPRLEEAVHLFRANSDPEGEADAIGNLGGAHVREGHFQEAAEAYDRALTLYRQLDNRQNEAVARINLGLLYLEHGKWLEARDEYEAALRIAEALGARDLSATALDSLGIVEYREGNYEVSHERSERALALYRDLGDRRGEALTLNSLGSVLLKMGERYGARARYEDALAIFRALKDVQGEATVLLHLGRVALAQGDPHRALELQKKALALYEQLENRPGLSWSHYGIAQALLALDDLDGAYREIQESLAQAERQRVQPESLDLRAFYFATRQHYWELYIDILLKLDRARPHQGFAARALEAEEGRRARSLLDALAAVRPAGDAADARLARAGKGRTLTLEDIQDRLLDTDTLLLIYSLGEERSVLWRVTRSTLAVHQLPRREQIETAAARAHEVLSHRLRPGSILRKTALDDLAALILKPVAEDLPKFRRLVIVADGALHLIPFAALPDPGAPPVDGRQPPLVERHPIIYLPSASVGATLRRERRSGLLRERGALVAIVADPVFETPETPAEEDASRGDLTRSVRDLGLLRLEPLPYSRKEAEAIESLLPGEVISVSGFKATREILNDERWRHAPILHFATHGLLNDRRPELSGLVFTQVNPDGTRRRDGFLRLQDIYDLKLAANLVVLSACQTGAGKELRGEGLLGMTRGFLSLGVPQLVVSLWKVEDRATAELMTRFYRQLFDGYLPPEALQRAQKSMLQEPSWNDPSLWAGFIFVGDFERHPGGGIEARDTGGVEPVRGADGAGMPPPKIKPKSPKPKPPGTEGGGIARNDPKLYFNGVAPTGHYLTPPASLGRMIDRLFEEGWQAPPEWVLNWTKEHGVDDPRRNPVLEVARPWDLAETGWAVVFPPNVDRRVKAALGDLLEHRRRQAGKVHSHYYRELTYKGQETYKFVEDNGGKPGMMADPEHLPYYVLLVGSPEELPYKLQSELDVNHAAGRICFEDPRDYANYARSVVQAEGRSRLRPREVVFFAPEHQKDPSTQGTAQKLVHPLAESVLEKGMRWDIREIRGAEARKKQLRALLGGKETPALLFAACHGLGFDSDDERQADCQGALACQDWPGPEDEEGIDEEQWFAASDVPDDASLHGLIAFFYACHGVGTPQRDHFDQKALVRPRPIAPRPLVARLPQRLLKQRNGALAVIGHVDRAWTATFAGSPQNEGIGAFLYGMRRLLQGHTVGWAMEYLNQSYAALAAMLGNMEEGWRYREEIDKQLFAHLWLIRNDARNFMVFGDPAVRLPGVGEPR